MTFNVLIIVAMVVTMVLAGNDIRMKRTQLDGMKNSLSKMEECVKYLETHNVPAEIISRYTRINWEKFHDEVVYPNELTRN